jgi:arylsulfatase A-like enzyme
MRKYFKVAAFSAFFCGSLCLAQTASKSKESLDSNLNNVRFKTEKGANPNILFIISDDHGWGDLPSNWDKTEVQMPRLDALANSGTRFTNYHTVPLCAPSRACLFTGQFTSENGMWRGPGGVPGEPGYKGIKRDVKMLSEYLSDAGYATGCFGKWHMGAQPGEFPNDRGFDEFRGFLSGSSAYWIKKERSKILHNGKPDKTEGHTTELFTKWSADFIRENVVKEKPFFCYLSYNAVHGPIRTDKSKPSSAPKEWVDKAIGRGVSFLRSDYVAVLEHMDYNIGKLVDLLDELKIRENTLIVFVSDNGACQMAEGPGGRFPGNNGAFRGCKGTTYQGGLSVPFLMNWQNQFPEGTISDSQVMHADVFATLLDVAGIPLPKMNGENPMRGMSLISHMKSGGQAAIPERTMIFELWGNVAIRKGNYKLWGDVGRDFSPDWPALVAKLKKSDLTLFDLSKDIGEQYDLRMQFPEVYVSLKKELVDHFINVNAEYPSAKTHPELFAAYKNVPELPAKKSHKKTAPKSKVTKPGPTSVKKGRKNAFVAMDSNGNGKVTLEELDGWFKNRAEKNPDKFTYKAEQARAALVKQDANKDDELTLEEWTK